MRLQDILSVKGTTVLTTSPQTSLAEAVRQMVEHKVGSMLVCGAIHAGRAPRGHRHRARHAPLFRGRQVRPDAADCRRSHDHQADHRLPGRFRDRPDGRDDHDRIRHVPVMNGERLVGMVSIGDLLKAQHDHLVAENQFMREYIQS